MKKIILFICMLFASFILVGCTESQSSGIEIYSDGNIHNLYLCETLQLNAKVYPQTNNQNVTWSTSDENIATVDQNGLVTAVSYGKVEITSSSVEDNTISQKYLIIVEANLEKADPESITVEAINGVTTCKVGETIKLKANVLPADASQRVIWVSSNPEIATVSNGVVRPSKVGEVTITVYPKDNESIIATINLSFEEADGPIYSNNWEEMEYTTHEEFMTCEDETPMKVKGVVTHINPISKDKVSYFIQNGADGYYVYSQDNLTMPVELGKCYEIGGFKKNYRGLCEFTKVEYYKELEESIEYDITEVTNLDVSSQDVMGAYQCSFVTGHATLESVTVSSKSYNFTATVNGVQATFRVDPTYASADEFAAINSLLQVVGSGAEFEFTGLIIAYSSSDVTPQILIVNESGLDFGEISDEELLNAASEKLEITKTVGFSVESIDLPTIIDGFNYVVISWTSDNEAINPTTGAVKHSTTDVTVKLVATLTLNNATIEKEFSVLVEAADDKEYEVVVSFDCEDALEPNSWGNSESKPSYAEGTVELGTPKYTWLLRNALIAAATNDKYNGTLGIRGQSRDSASETCRIEILESGEYNIVEFVACIYGNDVTGAKLRIEYSLDDGETWLVSDNIITLNNTTFETYRVKLPEGIKRVAIVIVEGTGRRVNFDDIKLMK